MPESKKRKGRKRKLPNRKSVWLADVPEYADVVSELGNQFEAAEIRSKARPDDQELARQRDDLFAELQEAKMELKENSTRYVMQAIGHKNYSSLVDDHPVDEAASAQITKEGADPSNFPWSPVTFPMALISASMVEPNDVGSAEEIKEWLEGPEWNSAEIEALFSCALEANTTRKIIETGKGLLAIPS